MLNQLLNNDELFKNDTCESIADEGKVLVEACCCVRNDKNVYILVLPCGLVFRINLVAEVICEVINDLSVLKVFSEEFAINLFKESELESLDLVAHFVVVCASTDSDVLVTVEVDVISGDCPYVILDLSLIVCEVTISCLLCREFCYCLVVDNDVIGVEEVETCNELVAVEFVSSVCLGNEDFFNIFKCYCCKVCFRIICDVLEVLFFLILKKIFNWRRRALMC